MSDAADLPDRDAEAKERLQREIMRVLVHSGAAKPILSIRRGEMPARAELFDRLQDDLRLLIDNLRRDFPAASSDHRIFNRLLDGQEALQSLSEMLTTLRSELGDELFSPGS